MPRKDQKTHSLERLRTAQKEWLQEVQSRTRRSLTEISRVAGFSPSTLTRFFNDRGAHQGALSSLTIIRIVEATGIQAPSIVLGSNNGVAAPATAPREAEMYEPHDNDGGLGIMVSSYVNGHRHLQLWQLKTDQLAAAGYRPGDVLVLDTNAAPREGDVVCAEVFTRSHQAETLLIWRLFEPPYITARPLGGAPARPRLVDGESVVVRGVVCAMLRGR